MTREQLQRYPRNWRLLAARCKELASWRCEHCGIEQGSILTSRRGNLYQCYLHAAHKHHDTENRQPELLCLCSRCHGRYDYQHREREKRVALERLKHQLLLEKEGYRTNLQKTLDLSLKAAV